MKSTSIFVFFLGLMVAATSCGPTVYTAPNFESVRKTQKELAILPFAVTITAKKLPKGTTPEMIKDQEKSNGYSMQSNVYSQFLREMGKGRYSIDFQDVDKTNAKLTENNISYAQLKTMDKGKLADMLGVDGIVSGTATMEKPMSDGAAVAIGVIFGVWGNTNQVNASLTVHGKDSKLLWKYDYEASGSVGSSTESLSKALMRNVSKKFPYKKKK